MPEPPRLKMSDYQKVGNETEQLAQYAWGFIMAGLNTLVFAYLYSTKRSDASLAVNILRSFVLNTLVVLGMPAVFGGNSVWFTFGVYECLVLVFAAALKRYAEKDGLVFDR